MPVLDSSQSEKKINKRDGLTLDRLTQEWANNGPRPNILWPASLLEEIHLVTFSIIILVN